MFLLARYSYRNLWVRRTTTFLTAGGMSLVVFVFTAVLMLALGLEKTLVTTGREDNAVFIRRSSETEVQSIIERSEAAIIETMPELSLTAKGEPFTAREVMVLIALPRRADNKVANVAVRGVTLEQSMLLRPQIKISSGRTFHPGSAEILVGSSLARRFSIGRLGEKVNFGTREWTVVGIMDGGGTGFDSEIWGDVNLIMSAFRRPVYSSVIGRLTPGADFADLRRRIKEDPRLTTEVLRETDYYAAQSRLMTRFIRILGLTLTMIFGLGAVIGSMVTMYSAVAGRTAEIGTLRALGFRRGTILGTFLMESVFLGLISGAVGIFAASFMDRLTISTMNWQSFSDLAFRFTLTRSIAFEGMCFSVMMGLAGGVLPALRAARMNIVTALRLR